MTTVHRAVDMSLCLRYRRLGNGRMVAIWTEPGPWPLKETLEALNSDSGRIAELARNPHLRLLVC
jgi:hypothetical protein